MICSAVYFLPRDILDTPSNYEPIEELIIAQTVDSDEGARSDHLLTIY
jgi:hypothetical protein